eukprot:451157-Prymnesium_polylepis.1
MQALLLRRYTARAAVNLLLALPPARTTNARSEVTRVCVSGCAFITTGACGGFGGEPGGRL